MEIVNKIVNKFGISNLLNFFVSSIICSMLSFVVILQEHDLTNLQKISCVTIGTIFVLILEVIKEYIIKENGDWKKLVYGILGCIPTYLSVSAGALFNHISLQ